jgi:predicted O-methyltransferase YrrM
MDAVDQLLERVRRETHGQLTLDVYRRIYETAARRSGTFVEIGTAQGAATIALALGARAAGQQFHIFTCDPFITGSRPRGSSIDAKIKVVQRGFEAFGVAGSITIVVGMVTELLAAADPRAIALLMLDADGRIDRDLAALHSRLASDCAIIIDDIEDRIYLHPTRRGLRIQQKHRLGHLLVDTYARHGLLDRREVLAQTGWYATGPARLPAEEIERLALDAYRQLVMTTVTLRDVTLKWRLYRWFDQHMPLLLRAYKRVRRNAPKARP